MAVAPAVEVVDHLELSEHTHEHLPAQVQNAVEKSWNHIFSDEEKMQNSAPTYLPQLLEDSRLKLLDEVLVHVEVAAALERGGEKLQSGDLDVEAQR